MSSPYRLSNPPGQGTSSAMGLRPIDVVTGWVNRNLRDEDIYTLPHEQITLNKILKIKCLFSKKANCEETFSNILSRSNVTEMFLHLYQRHSELYKDITKDFDMWRAEKIKSLQSSSSSSSLSSSPDEIRVSEDTAAVSEKSSKKPQKTTTSSNIPFESPVSR